MAIILQYRSLESNPGNIDGNPGYIEVQKYRSIEGYPGNITRNNK